ncbi:MAG: hypothetical protein JO113_00140 [Candidatus Eremiobacteraeota bacterium]|nr:hypothetical protein [Candidatus Eremiobacteraeota bacterium]
MAREAHLEYSWLTAASAVQLTGPGIVVIVRPGDNLYEINDRVESTTTAPRYASNDIYVSAGLATRIEQYARKAWLAFNNAIAARERMEAEAQTSLAELHGTIVMNVQPLKGAEALLVTGTAPPLAPVRVTLLATLSSDLPNVLVGRHDLAADPDGKFQAIIPIGPDYIRNSYLNVLATSGPGVTPANAQILIGPPNPELKVPWETFPGGIW